MIHNNERRHFYGIAAAIYESFYVMLWSWLFVSVETVLTRRCKR